MHDDDKNLIPENSGEEDKNIEESELLKESGSEAKMGGMDIKTELYNWAEAMVTALIIVVIVFALLVKVANVDGQSMEPTLLNKQPLLISHLFLQPKQGDIIVIRKKSFWVEPIVKRVIAVGGQTVNIDFTKHEVTVDGKVLSEPYIKEPTALEETTKFPLTVPEGFVFVMGDNRNNSTDSREVTLGCIDERYILGRVLLRIFPLKLF